MKLFLVTLLMNKFLQWQLLLTNSDFLFNILGSPSDFIKNSINFATNSVLALLLAFSKIIGVLF